MTPGMTSGRGSVRDQSGRRPLHRTTAYAGRPAALDAVGLGLLRSVRTIRSRLRRRRDPMALQEFSGVEMAIQKSRRLRNVPFASVKGC